HYLQQVRQALRLIERQLDRSGLAVDFGQLDADVIQGPEPAHARGWGLNGDWLLVRLRACHMPQQGRFTGRFHSCDLARLAATSTIISAHMSLASWRTTWTICRSTSRMLFS